MIIGSEWLNVVAGCKRFQCTSQDSSIPSRYNKGERTAQFSVHILVNGALDNRFCFRLTSAMSIDFNGRNGYLIIRLYLFIG